MVGTVAGIRTRVARYWFIKVPVHGRRFRRPRTTIRVDGGTCGGGLELADLCLAIAAGDVVVLLVLHRLTLPPSSLCPVVHATTADAGCYNDHNNDYYYGNDASLDDGATRLDFGLRVLILAVKVGKVVGVDGLPGSYRLRHGISNGTGYTGWKNWHGS